MNGIKKKSYCMKNLTLYYKLENLIPLTTVYPKNDFKNEFNSHKLQCIPIYIYNIYP
jgi:hypothetical protein